MLTVPQGVRYLQVVKRSGIKGEPLQLPERHIDMPYHIPVDKLEQMLGSYGPNTKETPFYVKNFDPEESPSGMLARSGTYNVRSRVVDDDGEVYAGMSPFASSGSQCLMEAAEDWEWSFKLAKEW